MSKLNLPFIKQGKFRGKRILSRVDFNVTVDTNNTILDETKIRENLPTIEYLTEQGAKLILFSHRSAIKDREKKINPSFAPILSQIERVIKKKLVLLDPRDLKEAQKKIRVGKMGQVFLFDNTRLNPAEELADLSYARELSRLGDSFVYDAFASYRPETTTIGLPRYLPTYIGFTMQQEIMMLSSIFKKPKRPLICIIGGAKTEVKVGIVRRFLQFADTVILGGSVANTFLQAWGISLGSSLVDEEMVAVARELLWLALHSRVALELPHDFMVAKPNQPNSLKAVYHTQIKREYAALDIGPATRERYRGIIKKAGTVVWNGPMGKYEDERYRVGTLSVLESVMNSKAKKIVGGGDTIASLPKGKRAKIDHVSTGGGAMLVFLESGTTAPIEAIRKYHGS